MKNGWKWLLGGDWIWTSIDGELINIMLRFSMPMLHSVLNGLKVYKVKMVKTFNFEDTS